MADPARIAALHETALLDTPPEALFDGLTGLARTLLRTPVALLTLVDEERQYFKSSPGLPEPWSRTRESPLSHSVCRHLVETGEALLVGDARTHPRTAGTPAVREMGIAAYAGVPLATPDGHVLGGLCAIDRFPRRWSAADVEALRALAAPVAGELQWRRERMRSALLELSLRESEAQYRALVQSANEAIVLAGEDGRILTWNRGARAIFGWEEEEVVGRSLEVLFPERHRETFGRPGSRPELVLRAVRAEGVRKDGSEFPLDLSVSRIRQGRRVLHSAILRDMTEQRRAQRDLDDLTTALQNAVEGISRFDPGGRLLSVNQAFAAKLGYEPAEMAGMSYTHSIHPADREKVEAGYRRMRAEGKAEVEARVVRSDGAERHTRLTLVSTRDPQGGFTGHHCFLKDITEWKALGMQLRHAQRLEAIGHLAAGVAHELNTPIQYVGHNLHFLAEGFGGLARLLGEHGRVLEAARAGPVPPALLEEAEEAAAAVDLPYLLREVPAALEQSREGVQRVAEIVRAMKELSHPGTAEKTPTDVNGVLRSVLAVARNEWRYVAEVATELDPALPPVPALPGDLHQAMLNVVVNAAHAVAEAVGDGARGKGTITVSTRLAGEWVEIRVSDTGPGIPEAARPRVFDLFFTTKEVGRGTGQGLTLAHAVVVDRHGGTITFETETGRGTTFVVRLPVGGAPPAGGAE